MIVKYHDLPINELVRKAEELVEMGILVFFKWTCEKCGSRQTFPEPNTLYKNGKCEECKHITVIEKGGFLTIMRM